MHIQEDHFPPITLFLNIAITYEGHKFLSKVGRLWVRWCRYKRKNSQLKRCLAPRAII